MQTGADAQLTVYCSAVADEGQTVDISTTHSEERRCGDFNIHRCYIEKAGAAETVNKKI